MSIIKIKIIFYLIEFKCEINAWSPFHSEAVKSMSIFRKIKQI